MTLRWPIGMASLYCALSVTAHAQAPSPERVDRVQVTPAKPAVGQPSYEESIEWLSGHTKLHCAVRARGIGGIEVFSRSIVSESKWPCVLLEVNDMTGLRSHKTATVTVFYFISLALVNSRWTVIEPGKVDPSTTCVNLKGADGMTIKLKATSDGRDFTEERLSVDSFCFDTVENAQRAAKALTHVAGLCGASTKTEPF